MIYSCFDPERGDYRLFEDDRTIPINSDLPVPSFGPDINGIGVPSMEAARPMPPGARSSGRSWHARGIIVNCGSGLGSIDWSASSWQPYVVVGGAALLLWWVLR